MNNLVIFRNELKNRIVPKYKLIGIACEVLLSKELFKNNVDTVSFLEEVFSVKYKDYVIKSRTTIIARTTRIINKSDEPTIYQYKKKLYLFIDEYLRKKDSYNGTH
ncbi:hypothetical protein [Limosilactobacillus galli]|uniref:hypothetical protein n=1 Tax=Limosilactobacillus galli TaxID=2991834 RepID=UPI0024BBB77B|nr:hypothetical protein [Limosilactobacillus galli]